MSTSGGIDRTGASITPQDFWRSDAGTNQPNGSNDTTEAISRTGLVGIGEVPSSTPVARLDVSAGGRSGTDPRLPGTSAYITGNLSAMPGFNAPGLPTPVCVAEFRHNNQSQGIGFAHNGIYATGSSGSQEFGLLNRGSGTHWKGWQSGTQAFDDNYLGAAVVVGTNLTERVYSGGNHLANWHKALAETIGPISTRMQWDVVVNGGMAAGMRLRPVSDGVRAVGVELYLDENRINKRKLVLFDSGASPDLFFGLGVIGNTLVYQIPANTAANWHGWYGGADLRMALFGNGQLRLHADQQASVPATDVPLFRDPVSGNVRQGAAGSVRASWAGTGVTVADGTLTLAIPAGRFTAAPVIAATVQKAATTDQFDIRVTAVSATSVTIKLRKALPVTILAISVVAAAVDAAGETVHIQAQAAG